MLNFQTGFYERLFDALDNNSVIMRVDEGGAYRPIWCSREYAEMMEGTKEECLRYEGGEETDSVHSEDKAAVAYLFKNRKTKDGTNSLTIRKYTVKNNEIWVNVHYAFVEEDGQQYAYCNYTDVTELKASQQQTMAMYQEQNKELEALSDQSLAALRSNLTKGVVEEVHGIDLYDVDKPGAPIEDLMTVRLNNMPVASDRETYMKVFDLEKLQEKYYLGEGPSSLVIFSRRQSGRQCFIKYSAAMRKDPATGDVIVLGVETEYNSQKVSEVLNEKVLAKQYDMVCYIVDENYGVSIGDAANIKKGSIFPKKRDGIYMDYIREQVIPFVSENERESVLQALSLSVITKNLEQEENYAVDVACHIDGEIYHKRFSFYPVDRETKFYILLKSDMTEVIREQQERNELLANALAEAEQANAAKTSFLSSMSHEIRTPMNAIIGLNSIALKDPELPEKTRDQLEKIDGSAKHLLSLINDVLDMSRIESGRMTLRHEEFSFREMLAQINTMINGQCRDKGLDYDCRITGSVEDVYIGDDMKLKQVIINILGNSVKFTPEGGTVSFIVESVSQFEDKATLRFIMKDTGIGMDKSYLPKIFDAFSQEDGNKANKYGSTGLGMAITKNIVEMMNGKITVESEKGVGSTFTVTVTLTKSDKKAQEHEDIRPQDMHVLVIDDDPVACEHAKLVLEEFKQVIQKKNISREEIHKAELKGRRILLAEDMFINAEIMKELLKMREMEVDHAENGELVVDMFKKSKENYYSAILMDVRMPVMTGLEATEAIRALDRPDAKAIPIIAMTANAFDEDVQRSLQVGMNAHLSKPVEPDHLYETLEILIKD